MELPCSSSLLRTYQCVLERENYGLGIWVQFELVVRMWWMYQINGYALGLFQIIRKFWEILDKFRVKEELKLTAKVVRNKWALFLFIGTFQDLIVAIMACIMVLMAKGSSNITNVHISSMMGCIMVAMILYCAHDGCITTAMIPWAISLFFLPIFYTLIFSLHYFSMSFI